MCRKHGFAGHAERGVDRTIAQLRTGPRGGPVERARRAAPTAEDRATNVARLEAMKALLAGKGPAGG